MRLVYPLSFFSPIILIGWKKYATLLPKKLASRDPTGAYAEEAWQTVGGRERISEIRWNVF
ncbi:hypothetical protein RCO48_17670 [Peribacillus frigoritolerans]|nr:hypothetical protein [Peribacillus frigoritolerans]